MPYVDMFDSTAGVPNKDNISAYSNTDTVRVVVEDATAASSSMDMTD